MWKRVFVVVALTLAACGGNKQVKPTGMDGGTTSDQPVTSESQPSR